MSNRKWDPEIALDGGIDRSIIAFSKDIFELCKKHPFRHMPRVGN